MKKVITITLIQSIAFVLIYNTLGYFFNHVKGNFFEYFKSQTFKNLFFLILMLRYLQINLMSYHVLHKRKNQ